LMSCFDNALEGIDIIYHLAGILGQSGIPDKAFWEINVQGTKNILDASSKHDIKRFIHCSTAGVTGPTSSLPQDESFPYNPSNIYELTKAEAEKLVLQYHRDAGLPVVVIRPEFVYGPGDTHTFGLFRVIQRRMFILIDGGRAIWHPTYIDDLIRGFLLSLGAQRANGQIYIIAGERYVSIKELSNIIADSLNIARPVLNLSAWHASILANIIENLGEALKFNPPLSEARVKTFCRSSGCSTRKARDELGYVPATTLIDGIQRTAKWYKDNHWL
jgi:dihydroflavonol-4-reductase